MALMSDDPNLWMLDLDEKKRPLRAHLIVEERDGVRTTACGERATAGKHPRGWWTTRAGSLPLVRRCVHCGVDRMV
jgi:hypothetical protein